LHNSAGFPQKMSPSAHIAALSWRVCFALLPLQSVVAQSGVWNNPGGGSWSSQSNWSGSQVAGGIQADADFSSIDLASDATVTLNGARTVGNLLFGDSGPSHDWSLRKGTSGGLTLDVTSGNPVISVINRTVTIGVDLFGSDGLTKEGTGTLHLTGVNTYSGPTRINAGVLRLSAPPAFPSDFKVMPLGDSITLGYNGGNAGYRGTLYGMMLTAAPGFRFVGASQVRPGFLPASPTDQRRHEGRSSYNIQDVNLNLDGYDNARFLQYGGDDRDPHGGHWLTGGGGTGRAAVFPDVITMMLGTNDLDIQPGVETRLRSLITKITTLRPATRLIVARITPVTVRNNVNDYNAIVDQVVADFIADGKKVSLVDMNTNFPAGGLFTDGVHPNDTGFSWMALQWYDAIMEALTPEGGQTHAIPAASPVTVAGGALLDLDGTLATMGTLSVSGNVDLGTGGTLASAGAQINPTGALMGSGTVQGNFVLNGSGIGYSGQSLVFTGSVTNNANLQPSAGSAMSFNGGFTNNGVVTIAPGRNVSFSGNVTNNGVLRVTDGATLNVSGTLINNGTIDILTGDQTLPQGLVNFGWIIDSSAVKLQSLETSQNSITLKIESYSGHIYQLQHNPTLEPGGWLDLGPPRDGSTGTTLEFETARSSPTGRDFYRIKVSP
jgi:autotransporter-associated beta strand protein